MVSVKQLLEAEELIPENNSLIGLFSRTGLISVNDLKTIQREGHQIIKFYNPRNHKKCLKNNI